MVSRCRQLFDLDADPAAIGSALASDDVLAPLVHARPGLRVPGAYDGFELAVRAVLGQQVSVAAARTFAARLAARYGALLAAGRATGRTAARSGGLGTRGRRRRPPPVRPARAFPGLAADADLSGLGLTRSRQATLRALAGAMAAGRLDLDPGTDPAEAAARLSELPGIGPWTVAYILMRAVRDPDAYPETDLGLRRAIERLGCPPARAGRVAALAGVRRAAPVDLGRRTPLQNRAPPNRARRPPLHRRTAGSAGPMAACWWPAVAAGSVGLRAGSFELKGDLMSADDAILVTVLDTPIGPLSLLAHDGALVGGGFTADPAELHVRMHPSLRGLGSGLARLARMTCPGWSSPCAATSRGSAGRSTRSPCTSRPRRPGSGSGRDAGGRTGDDGQLHGTGRAGGQAPCPRAAGAACAANLIAPVVPCHRALRGDGSLGGYYYGRHARSGCCVTRGVQGR